MFNVNVYKAVFLLIATNMQCTQTKYINIFNVIVIFLRSNWKFAPKYDVRTYCVYNIYTSIWYIIMYEFVPATENDQSSNSWKPSRRSIARYRQPAHVPPSVWNSSSRAPSSRRFAQSDCIVWTLLPHRDSDSESPVTSSLWKERGEIVIDSILQPVQWSTVHCARAANERDRAREIISFRKKILNGVKINLPWILNLLFKKFFKIFSKFHWIPLRRSITEDRFAAIP